jgi:hypothetical protein
MSDKMPETLTVGIQKHDPLCANGFSNEIGRAREDELDAVGEGIVV